MKPNRALIVLTLLLALATILSACAPAPTPAPTQAPVSTEAPRPTRPPETTVPPPDLWAQIQRSGVLRVGTSADYPPFEYYDARYQLDGFDIGLIRAIGRDLGLKVEIKDYAFDGLYNALQLGSIDAAIAAITVTPDRQQYVDFSNDYYAGKGAALAAADSKLSTITDMAKLASLVVGVQTGSVYESTVQKELVATGLMPAKNVQSYPDIGQAVNDLKRNRLDVVLLDLQPAQSYANEGGVKIVGEGLKPQSYAIAIPKGAESLRRVLNQAISAIIASGEYDRLAALHLGLKPDDLEPLPPTPAPTQTPVAPAPTAAPPAGCIDDMSYVADITYDDKNMTAPPVLQPGQTFVKTWRIRNSGTCAWDSKFYLAYASGNSSLSQMGGQPTYIIGTVAPGATYDISVNLTAPTQPGVYQGFWQMNNAAGQAFGTKVYVGIQVVAPTPTPAPTQPASITFTVNQTNITAGQCVVFNWNVQNVQAVYFYAEGENPQENGVAGQGSQTECPTQTTTYYLSVVYTNGSNTTPGDHDQRGAAASWGAHHCDVHGGAPPDQCGPVRRHPVGGAGQRAAGYYCPQRHRLVERRARAGHAPRLPAGRRQHGLHAAGDGPGRSEWLAAHCERRRPVDCRSADRGAAHGDPADGCPARPPRRNPRRSWERTGCW